MTTLEKKPWTAPKLEELAPDVLGALEVLETVSDRIIVLEEMGSLNQYLSPAELKRTMANLHGGVASAIARLTQTK